MSDLLSSKQLLMQDDGVAQSATAPSLEFLKNGDAAARLDIARVVDVLSGRVSLLDLRMRLGDEVFHFVHGADGCDDLHPLHHLVWSRIAFTIGFVHPTNTGADAAS
ncbi:hypothetical protein [Bradyrhizobium sp. CCBAU 51765]|uniref:hypothetical protein n=1 Tax=Bradyrhizobium sp. CCBAU 51765 TaxID=1325102 RepID=UPI001887C376|nr:hypothetical protein [Bradyrhizobium sp. CCBAU 51765]